MNPYVTLWTVQSNDAVIELLNKGALIPTTKYQDEDFRNAYSWMARQLEEKVKKPEGVETDAFLWCWYKWGKGRHRKRPRHTLKYWAPAGAYCLITFRKKIDDVRVSDYFAWESVLGGTYVGLSFEEDISFHPSTGDANGNGGEDQLISSSWLNIFDLEAMSKKHYDDPAEQRLQAVFWKLEISEVVSFEPFVSIDRPRRLT